ncbi:DUF998 domain-containing protein [Acetobacterium wieringae]|uniref:DUF998 domain-containing protein n=1 Tax=Acetobacterium wieringae TaxID=52694 RepID=UPI0026F0BE59|nr:DUF998 domain-containing protein [Acetobacterium wieringae]
MIKKRELINWLGLLGVASFLSYLIAVLFAPLAYPGYNWLSQAVSDLSAYDAPSRELWGQLSSVYGICGIVSVTLACVYVQNRLNKTLRVGIYLFAIMNWVSTIGYSMFPLTTSGYAGAFQDVMHIIVTVVVVLLSVASLVTIMVGGYREKKYVSMAVLATISLSSMLIGAIGTGLVPIDYFGVTERFSVFAATAFTAILGLYVFYGIDYLEK